MGSNEGKQFGSDYYKHVAAWIESVLNGALENFAEQAREELMSEDEKSANLTDLYSGNLQEKDSGGTYLNE